MLKRYFAPLLLASLAMSGCQTPDGKTDDAFRQTRPSFLRLRSGRSHPRGLGKKYPVSSNRTAQGRAENRRVAVVISTP